MNPIICAASVIGAGLAIGLGAIGPGRRVLLKSCLSKAIKPNDTAPTCKHTFWARSGTRCE
jgi:hypothetical protein